ncbi:MAG: glycosyltransferase [Armatimonadota bacterium]
MLSIAIFSECYHPMRNGVVVSVASFAGRLTELGHRVTIFTARHPDQRGAEDGIFRFPSITFPTRARYPIALPLATGDARRALEEMSFDVIHSNAPMIMGRVALAHARRRGVPLVFTYHTLIEEYTHYIPLPRPLVRSSAVWASRSYSNQVDHIITPSEYAASRLREYGVTRPIAVIPTGIDLEIVDAMQPADIRAQYGIPAGVPLLAYAGRLAREKNIPRVLGAFRRVLESEPDAHLLLIGGGAFDRGIVAMAKEMGIAHRTRVTGLVDRAVVMQCLREADLFVFASQTETQGLVIGEAMACGTAVVAVASHAAREIITDGREGLLVEDAAAPFADAILSLLHDPARRKEIGRHARLRAETLSVPQCTERLLDVYNKVISG